MIKNSLFRKKEVVEPQEGAGTVNEAYYAPEQMNTSNVQYGTYQQNQTNAYGEAYGQAAYGMTGGQYNVPADQAVSYEASGQGENDPSASYGQEQNPAEYAQAYSDPSENTAEPEETAEPAEDTGSEDKHVESNKPDSFSTLSIPLDQIDENPINDKIFNMKGIESLMTGIEKDGYLQAIGVFLKDDGRYEIFTGHRRYRAMKKLYEEGKLADPTIPGVVFPMPESEDEKTEKLISSNIRNRPEEPMDIARAIYEYESIRVKKKDYTGKLRDVVADYFGISPTKVYRFECLMRLIPELQELANTHGINYNVISRASMLSEEDQHKLYDTLIKYARAEIAVVKQEIKRQGTKEEGINEINFEEITARVLSGQKINTEINLLLEQNEEEDEKQKTSVDDGPDNTGFAEQDENDDEPITGLMVSGDDEESEGSDEDDESETMKAPVRPSSAKSMNRYMTELEKMIENDDEILQDKDEIRNYLDRLKKLIAMLEKML